MATPTYATDLALINAAESTTGWTAVGGGGAISAETDFFLEQSNSISKATQASWDSGGTPRGGVLYNNGSGVTIPTDGCAILWAYWWAPGVLATEAAGGAEFDVGNSTTAYKAFYFRGTDTWEFGGWVAIPVNPAGTASRTQGSPSGTWQYFGWQAYVAAAVQVGKGNPWGCDVIRYGRGELQATNGQSGAYASFGGNGTDAGAAVYDNANARRWGLLIPRDGAFYQQGLFVMGQAGTAVDFRDSNRVIFIQNTKHVTAPFNGFQVLHASSNVEWTSISVTALGTVSKGTFTVTDNAVVALTDCVFTDMSTFSFLSNTTANNCTFRRCGAITAAGANMSNSTVAASSVAADASALVWDVATDPDTKMTDMSFTKGTNAHHAIEFGTSSPTTMTLRGIDFSGFNASDAQNDSALRFLRTTGTITVNLIGCSGTIKVKKEAGATVNLVIDPVSLAVHVQDINTEAAIAGARVWVPVTSTAGGRPYNSSITSINRSGSTATVVMGAVHGMATNDYVDINGATESEYNGTFQVTVTSTTEFTYTVTGTPATPAGGTKTATFVVISTTTDGSGNASASYSWAASQPISGRVRTATGAGPYYKTAPVTGTISNTAGLSVTVQMIPDA